MNPDKIISKSTVQAVSCLHCKKLIQKDSGDYIAIHGNVYVGEDGGLVGNNFNPDGTLARATFYCTDPKCHLTAFEYTFLDKETYWKKVLNAAKHHLSQIKNEEPAF